jgi:hypothetical protein
VVCIQLIIADDIPLDVYAHTDVDQAFGLPISNAPAHEWSTFIIALDQLSRVNEVVTLGLYPRENWWQAWIRTSTRRLLSLGN